MSRGKLNLNLPITIIYKSGKRTIKSKTIKNRTIDELFDLNFDIPGIKITDEILAVGLGEIFETMYQQKYNIKS
jgi:hypothetical protein